MNSNGMQDPAAAAALQAAQLDTLEDPLARAAGVSVASQNMATAKKKLENTVRDLTVSVDNQNVLMRAAQSELSDIDQKAGALQARIAMAKVVLLNNPKNTNLIRKYDDRNKCKFGDIRKKFFRNLPKNQIRRFLRQHISKACNQMKQPW